MSPDDFADADSYRDAIVAAARLRLLTMTDMASDALADLLSPADPGSDEDRVKPDNAAIELARRLSERDKGQTS